MKKFLIVIASLVGFVLFWLLVATMLGGTTEENKTGADNNFVGYDELLFKDSLEVVRKANNNLNRELRLKASEDLLTFQKNIDEFSGDTFYHHPKVPKYTNRNFIFPYIGETKGVYFLRLVFQYEADDWLFINQLRIKTDAQDYSLTLSFERDHDNGRIWEWADMYTKQAEIDMLHDMATSEKVLIRYIGRQYKEDRELTKMEKEVITTTLEIFENINVGLY